MCLSAQGEAGSDGGVEDVFHEGAVVLACGGDVEVVLVWGGGDEVEGVAEVGGGFGDGGAVVWHGVAEVCKGAAGVLPDEDEGVLLGGAEFDGVGDLAGGDG